MSARFKIESDFLHEGMRCAVISSACGHRCGYVAVSKTHPLHGVKYDEAAPCLTQEMADAAMLGKKSSLTILAAVMDSDDCLKMRRSPDVIFDVHGGLTYSGPAGYPVEGEGLWWFGFDANHHNDAKDPALMDTFHSELYAGFGRIFPGTVRTKEYMENECKRLADQLAAISTACSVDSLQ